MRRKVRPISATTGREEHQNTMDKRTMELKQNIQPGNVK